MNYLVKIGVIFRYKRQDFADNLYFLICVSAVSFRTRTMVNSCCQEDSAEHLESFSCWVLVLIIFPLR